MNISSTGYMVYGIILIYTSHHTDLCNNPMTKEAKLSAAQRIVPEWKDYDAEIKNLMARIDDEQHQEHSIGKQQKKGTKKRMRMSIFHNVILTNTLNILQMTQRRIPPIQSFKY